VGNKPDTALRTSKIGIYIDQGTFEERSNGFNISKTETFDEIILRYIEYLRKHDDKTAVFNTAAEYGIFSKHWIKDVIFLIRHPLHAYVSWGKPERHKNIIDYLGGLNSSTAVEFYSKRWKGFTNECIKLDNLGILGGVIRFEFVHQDVKKIGGIEWVFDKFDPNKRNFGFVERKFELMMEQIVSDNYYDFYDSWNI